MKVGFRDDSFAFELVRNLGFTYYGGADIAELFASVDKIVEGDFDSWYAEWHARGERVLGRAQSYLSAGHLVSAREAFLRASTYFRMAEFYLHGDPDDPRILGDSTASQQAYAKGAELMGPTWEPIEIPYEGTTLPGYFYKPDESDEPRPTLVFHGGYDSSVEELYYFAAAAATRRGYNCLTFDGPGQGMPLREQKLYFRHDWEKVVTPAVDYALSRPDVDADRLALKGMSLGGYLAARAAAFEPRFSAVILFDGVWSFTDSIWGILPPDAREAFDAGDADTFNTIVEQATAENTQVRWTFTQGTFSFGCTSAYDLTVETTKMTLSTDVVDRITCPTLVMEADGDQFFRGQPERVYEALTAPKTFARFTAEDGAENHCQSGALAYKDEVVFNWLDDALKA
ncbi:alpha/beta fold hydrolase [Mycolicibacterium sp. 018/SC-01/001]|uniref:alpha/beta hydrolase family protein n=1 Tax=Mycolicibacterium sp. 018/SC-01/001 TaxID=2592069 RepID=UPI00117F5C6B|nr:alpha/beta fold hydrolase [Mycolicibacterium sp. 018/SC-01/001]TRW80747.1 alpha/beta fold hydrolase [Mycolicibacterium sp. 018/SC-01/001]